MSIREKVDEYKKILDIFPNDQEKYQYLIEKAKENDSFPLELRLDNFKVNGCQSQVWLVPEEKDEKLFFNSDSDALIAKGLVTLIASIYSDEKAEDIVSSEIDLMEEFDLGVILSPARRNGAYSMLKTIKEYAKNLVNWADVIRKTYYDGGIDEIISTRRLVHIIEAYSIFKDKMKAIELCVNRFDDDTKASFLDLYTKVDAGEDVSNYGQEEIEEESNDSEEEVDNNQF